MRKGEGRRGWRAAATRALLFSATLLGGCAAGKTYLHPQADLSFYQKVGVIPFATLGPDRLAGDEIASVFTAHLMVSRRFEVAEPGTFLGAYAKEVGTTGAPPIGLPPEALKPIAEQTQVQGVFEGTVRDYDFTRGNSPRPIISVEVRLVDVGTSQVVWSTSVTRVGKPIIPFLGLGGAKTLSELAEDVAATLVDRLPR